MIKNDDALLLVNSCLEPSKNGTLKYLSKYSTKVPRYYSYLINNFAHLAVPIRSDPNDLTEDS